MRAPRSHRWRTPNALAVPARGVAIASCALLAALAHAYTYASPHAHAQDGGVHPSNARVPSRPAPAPATMRIAAPADLAPGMRATVDVFVRPPDGPEQPLLLTPSSEGEAVRVVRGRLLRVDARRTAQGELHFQVPIEARSAGTAVLRFALLAYRCAARCTALRLSESITVQVRVK